MTGPFEHPWLGGLLGDDEAAAVWSAERQLSHMLAFEAAWSRACGAAGLFDEEQAEAAARTIEQAEIDPSSLRDGMARDGVPIPALVRQLRAEAGAAAEAVHDGATSQDVVDSALALTLQETSNLLQERLETLLDALDALAERFGAVPLMGRTRMQAAREIRVADRIASWSLPLSDHLERLARLRGIVERVQLGGAAGDRAALGAQAEEIVAGVAGELGLQAAEVWHARRDGIADYASFLSLVSGSLGKMGQDICLMAQQGLDEITLSGGGGSSAMAHKRNPVKAEVLVALARFNAVQVSAIHQALVHEQERSGAAWTLEWMVLPQMAQATARGLALALELVESVEAMGEPDA